MGKTTRAEPIEIVVHDDAVIVTGFGEHHLILTAQAAEKLAYRLSGAAFAASSWLSGRLPTNIDPGEWRTHDDNKEPAPSVSSAVRRVVSSGRA